VNVEITNELIYWRGPSPFHFVTVPARESKALRESAAEITYGWGVLPTTATIGETEFTTSLFPKDGLYLVPVKVKVRRAEGLELGDIVTVRMEFDLERGTKQSLR